MKRVFLFLIAAALCFVSCGNDDNNSSNSMEDMIRANISGRWIIDEMDDLDIPTNEIFVMDFDGAGVQGYGFRAVDGDNSSWSYTTSYYRVSGDRIYLDSDTLDLEIQVIDIDDDDIKYRVISYLESDVDQQETNVYEGRKVANDYATQIIGEWKGIDAQYYVSSNIPENQHVWIFSDDDSFVYKSYDAATSNWVAKDDNDGEYMLFGDLLILEYTNSHLTNIDGRSCDVWEVDIDHDGATTTMDWEATSADGSESGFYLSKQ